jgi:gamma-glutamylcyclotransferase (GGCT)/AIG2-like uncharacterized protein YtfP
MTGCEPLHYFAYGSNLSAHVMATRCPDAVAVAAGSVTGWELTFRRRSLRWGGHAADLRPHHHGVTWGVVWRVSPAGWRSLDRYEAAYRRETVVVATPGGSLEAVTYLLSVPDEEGLPAAAYKEAMVDGARQHGVPDRWCRSLSTLDVAAT